MALAFICLGCNKVKIDSTSNPTSSGIIMYGNQYGNTLQSFGKTSDGGYFFSGFTLASAASNQQGFIQKTDKNGKIEWYHEYGGKYYDKFISTHQTSDGGFIACGLTSSVSLFSPQLNYNTHAYIVKTDANGNPLWQKVFGGQFNDEFYDVAETPDHDFVATGSFQGISLTNEIERWLYVVKVNQNGDSLWTYKTSTYYLSIGTSIAVASDGSIGVTGGAKKTDSSFLHPLFGYFSASGQLSRPVFTFDSVVTHDDLLSTSPEPMQNEKLISTPGGFIFICGASNSGSYALDQSGPNYYEESIIASKIDQKGNFVWSHPFTGQGNGVELNDAMVNPDGSVLISCNVPNSAWLLNLNSSGIKTSEIFIPGISFVEGCTPVGNSYALGLNLIPASSNHAYYYGLAITDQNGKIK